MRWLTSIEMLDVADKAAVADVANQLLPTVVSTCWWRLLALMSKIAIGTTSA